MATITETATHFYGHGQSWLLPRTTGGAIDVTAATGISLPEVDSVEVTFENEKVEHVSKRDAMASVNLSVVKMVKGMLKITCSQHVADLLALYLFGTKTAIAGGTVTAVSFDSGIVANAFVPFPGDRTNFSTFTSIIDSAGSPATLTQGTDYLVDEKAGMVKFLIVSGFTQPFKVTGVEAAGNGVGLIQSRVQEKWLRHKAINIANSDAVEVLDLYRVQIDPASSWTLVNDGNDVQKYEIGGQLLKDTTKSSSATFGQYGRLRQ